MALNREHKVKSRLLLVVLLNFQSKHQSEATTLVTEGSNNVSIKKISFPWQQLVLTWKVELLARARCHGTVLIELDSRVFARDLV